MIKELVPEENDIKRIIYDKYFSKNSMMISHEFIVFQEMIDLAIKKQKGVIANIDHVFKNSSLNKIEVSIAICALKERSLISFTTRDKMIYEIKIHLLEKIQEKYRKLNGENYD